MKIEKVPLDKISVGDRARINLGDIEKLQNSIEHQGLLHPLIIDDAFKLVAGFRRLSCCKNLGFKEIDVRLKKDLSDVEKKELELEENIHEALKWDEEASLRRDIHKLKQELYGKPVKGHVSDGWTLEDTAESLGVALGTLSQDITLANALDDFPKLKNFTSKRQAVKALTKAKETAILSELAKRDVKKSSLIKNVPYLLHNGDAYKFLTEKVEDETIDLVIFDPPWGIDIDIIGSSRGLSGDKTSYYDDSAFSAKGLMEQLLPELYRVMKPNTHMYIFFALEHYQYLLDSLAPYFSVRKSPLIWVKEGGGFTDFEVRFMPRYETILFCNKGLRRLNSACSDVLNFNRPLSVERMHTQQKPVELLQQLIRLSTQFNEIVLDPCAGSFSSIVASTLLGRRSIGIEKDVDAYNKGLEWIKGVEIKEKEEDNDDA